MKNKRKFYDVDLAFDEFLDHEFDVVNKGTKGETHRWLFCESQNRYRLWQQGIPDDCGCCLDDADHGSKDGKRLDDIKCTCDCHYRIGQIKYFIHKWINKYKDKEICICAAVKSKDGQIIRGNRHSDCIQTLIRMNLEVDKKLEAQGFITSKNRYVTREQGRILQDKAEIKSLDPEGYRYNTLFSEDLY